MKDNTKICNPVDMISNRFRLLILRILTLDPIHVQGELSNQHSKNKSKHADNYVASKLHVFPILSYMARRDSLPLAKRL